MTKYDDDVFELIDGKRVLKDRARLRVPMTARDRRGVNPYLSDVQRAVATDAATRDARARAYELYDQEVGQAWRNGDADPWSETNPPTGFGSHGPRGAVEGDACTINGAKGRLKLVAAVHSAASVKRQSAIHRRPRERSDSAPSPRLACSGRQ
jgi:hypothetical protein